MKTQQQRDEAERKRDKTIEDSFPASDPPANTGIVGPGTGENSNVRHRAPEEPGIDERPTGQPSSGRHTAETAHAREDKVQVPEQR
jgi:hypothetical protein